MTHVQEVMGSNQSAIYWMDMTFVTLICCKNCIVCYQKMNIENKEKKIIKINRKKGKKYFGARYEMFCAHNFVPILISR